MKISSPSATDGELVSATLAGSREAFGTLVERHQQFVCALAYARTGSVAASEDIAQETFVAAWKNLARLRAPENFRGWLSGTARHLAARFHRDRRATEPLPEHLAAAPDDVMSREEEAMLWATLEQLPESVREPLVLFYRGGQSAREVAEALEISEDAVKQRLSRGRAMLRDAVREKVEGALVRSRPGAAFTITVLAAIPVMTSTAQAAGAGLVIAKGSSAALPALVGVAGSGLIGLLGAWFGMTTSLERAESARERRFIRRVAAGSIALVIVMMTGLFALVSWGQGLLATHPGIWIALMVSLVLGFVAGCGFFAERNTRIQLRIRAEERAQLGLPVVADDARFLEYRSRWEFLGLPMVHVRLGNTARHVACGWIAYGNIAIAPLFAAGGVAVGGIAVGGVAAGFVTMGAVGLGLLSFAGLALGGLVIGGLAIGGIAIGGAAVGGVAAMGGQAWAGLYGIGRHVTAPHANDALAKAFFQDHGLTQAANQLVEYGWAVQFAVALVITLMCWWVRRVAKRKAN